MMDGTPRERPERDRPFDPSKVAAGEGAASLVTSFLRIVDSVASRKRARRGDDQKRHVDMASALVLDLAHLWVTAPEGWLAVSLQKGFYSPERRQAGFLTEKFIDLVNLLAAAGVLELRRGFQGAMGAGRRTTIRAGTQLKHLFAAADVMHSDIGRNRKLLRDCLVLKSRKVRGKATRLRVPDNELTRALRADVESINDWIALADLSWAGDEREDGIDLGDRFVWRTFNNGSFEDGGRLFGGFWHRKDRLECVFFGDQPAVSLDYGQMGVRSAYSMAGAVPPPGDLYEVPGLEGYRSGVKTLLSALLAADRIPTRMPKRIRSEDLFPPVVTFGRAYRAIEQHHEPIKHLFGTSLCYRQMYEESCLLVDILLRLMDQGVVALPVHDCILIGQQNMTIAEQTMKELFEGRFGIEAVVDVSFPTSTITLNPSVTIGLTSDSPIEGAVSL